MADETKETTIETTPPAVTDRKSAIAAAVASVESTEKAEESKEEKPKEEAKPEDKKEEKVEEPKDEEKELVEQGKQLMLALRDPSKAPIVIKFLAEQAGYTKQTETVKSEKKAEEIKGTIEDYLKESLGPEFEFLAEKIGKGVEKFLDKKVAESQADIRARFERDEHEKLQTQSAAAFTKVSQDFFGTDEPPENVQTEMSKYLDRIQVVEGTSVKDLVEDAFYHAVGKLGISKSDKSKNERTNKNRSDAAARLASARAPQEDNLRRDDSKPLSRREAIQQAIELASKEN